MASKVILIQRCRTTSWICLRNLEEIQLTFFPEGGRLLGRKKPWKNNQLKQNQDMHHQLQLQQLHWRRLKDLVQVQVVHLAPPASRKLLQPRAGSAPLRHSRDIGEEFGRPAFARWVFRFSREEDPTHGVSEEERHAGVSEELCADHFVCDSCPA